MISAKECKELVLSSRKEYVMRHIKDRASAGYEEWSVCKTFVDKEFERELLKGEFKLRKNDDLVIISWE